MICQKCGAEMPDNVKFCTVCGAPLSGVDSIPDADKQAGSEEIETQKASDTQETPNASGTQETPNASDTQETPNASDMQETSNASDTPGTQPSGFMSSVPHAEENNSGSSNHKKLNIKMIAGICIAAAAVIVIAVLVAVNSHTIKLNDYVTITFSGSNGYGTAYYEIDEDALIEACSEKIKVDDKILKQYDLDSILSSSDLASVMINYCISVDSLEPSSNLKNGDKVTLKWDCDDETAKSIFGVKFKYSDIEKEVADLSKPEQVDLFEGVNVKFDGVSGEASANVEFSEEHKEIPGLDYYFDYPVHDSGSLEVGDKVILKVKAYSGDLQEVLGAAGYTADVTEKEFEVTGLSKYAAAVSDISSDTIEKLKAQMKDEETSWAASNWRNYTLKSFTYDGCTLLVRKNPGSTSYSWGYSAPSNNRLVMYFKSVITATADDGSTQDLTYESAYYYNNLVINTDGNSDIDISNIVGHTGDYHISSTIEKYTTYYLDGYASRDDAFKSLVTAISDECTYEDSVV
ncbi:MAG: zinc-ribbon domain-containing protein [Eubacterium sp.]